jgi:hypothetical protein
MVLTGDRICSLMRLHGVTMRAIKIQYGITLKRIRQVRAEGVRGFMAEDWFHIITGRWPGQPAGGQEVAGSDMHEELVLNRKGSSGA